MMHFVFDRNVEVGLTFNYYILDTLLLRFSTSFALASLVLLAKFG
jgi:hypothetical protein